MASIIINLNSLKYFNLSYTEKKFSLGQALSHVKLKRNLNNAYDEPILNV